MPKETLTEVDDIKDDDLENPDDVEIIVKGEEEPEEKEEQRPEKKKAEAKEGEDGDEPDEDDEPDEEEEDEETIRERRRKEKLARKERREKAIHRDKVEMNFLRSRNEELEKRMMAQELRSTRQEHYTIEQRIEEAELQARNAEQVLARAIAEANGDDAASAIKYRDEAIEKIRQLTYYRDKLATEEKQIADKPKVDPLVTSYAQDWMARNPWYDGQGRDLDSKIVLTIDQSLVDEGYVPRTAQYWKELDRRVRSKLPHRFEHDSAIDDDEDESPIRQSAKNARTAKNQGRDDQDDRDSRQSSRPKKGPPIGQSSESASGQSKKREIYISPERKEALIQAGVWDDPVLRMRYVKRYQEWDKENASR